MNINMNTWDIYAELTKWAEDRWQARLWHAPLFCHRTVTPLPECSKKLSAAKREELYDVIMKEAVAVGIGMRSPERIDEINILKATYEAMRDAISNLSVTPQLLLNDAVTIPEVIIPQVPIIKGDAKSVSIAAASIVAKVTRDRMMEEYDKVLPGIWICIQQRLWIYGSH